MANKERGQISLTHAGKSYTLELDFNALCEFEEQTGKDALPVLEGMEQGKISVRDMRALMWAGLKQHHPEVTLAEAGQILTANASVLGEAVSASFSPAEPLPEGKAKPSRPAA